MITYAKVGGPPDNWMHLRVRDLKTGELVNEVVQVNAAEGWLRRYKQVNGKPVLDPASHSLVIERIRGRFAIEEIER